MTLTEANEIWTACYGSTLASETADGWDRYTCQQREEAIRVRSQGTEGGWGVWNIGDRH